MKLNEIFGIKTPVRNNYTDRDLNNARALDSRGNFLGRFDTDSGSFGAVRPVIGDPTAANVVKSSLVAAHLEQDPYYQFVSYVVAHDSAEDNRYIPRIYSVRLTHGKEYKGLYHVNMERLEKLAIVNDYEDTHTWKGIYRLMGDTNVEYVQTGYYVSNLLEIVNNYCKQGIKASEISDDKFYEALDIWKKIRKRTIDSIWDIRATNMMFRRTSTGLQLVFTDLLYNAYGSNAANYGIDI